MSFSKIARFEAFRSLLFGSISGTFAAVGSILTNPLRLIKILNTGNADVIISFDQVTNHIYLPATSFDLYDLNANQSPDCEFKLQANTQVYAKQASGALSSGGIYVMGVYGVGE